MPFASTAARIDRTSKCTLLGSVLLLVYSCAVLITHAGHSHHPHWHRHGAEFDVAAQRSHQGADAHGAMGSQRGGDPFDRSTGGFRHFSHHDHAHHHHGPHDEGIAIVHFGVLGVATAVTGIIAAFSNRRGVALAFIVLVLATELLALGVVGARNMRAVEACQKRNTAVVVKPATVSVAIAEIVDQKHRIQAEAIVVDANPAKAVVVTDPIATAHCVKFFHQAAVISCMVIGVAACMLACCASRFTHALAEGEMEDKISAACNAANNAAPVVMAVIVDAGETKTLPVKGTLIADAPTLV